MTYIHTATTLQHPHLPADSSLIERIVLPAVFSIVVSAVKNEQHKESLKEYLLAVRDAISGAYPGE